MNAPNTPTLASHQMCKIIAKPMTTAKKAVTKPVALFFGISTGSYWRVGVGSSFVACARLLLFQKASSPATLGWNAKFHAGGGDAVAHSSVRPFHGSPVTSRSDSRLRIDTTSCTIWQTTPTRMIAVPKAAAINHGCQDKLS